MDLKDYKNQRTKIFKLPTGFEITVRKLSPYTIFRLKSEMKDEEMKDLLSPQMIDILFKEFLISPKIPEEITVEEFDADDFRSILDAVLSQIILTKGKELEEVVDEDKDFHT